MSSNREALIEHFKRTDRRAQWSCRAPRPDVPDIYVDNAPRCVCEGTCMKFGQSVSTFKSPKQHRAEVRRAALALARFATR